MFDKVVERFLRLSPVTVLSRLAVQRALDPTWLDNVFRQHRDRTYEKDLLFSSVIEVTSHVVLGLQPSLHAAYRQASLDVSFQALYGKVGRTEPSVLRAMVRGSYERLAPVVDNWAVRARRLVPGHRVRIFDGNDLPASEKRLAVLRGFRGAALPGQSLVVYDPDLDLAVDALPWADAHDHERTLMKEMMAEVQAGDVNVADRAFSTRDILRQHRQRRAYLIVREHGRNPNPTEVGRRKFVGRVDTGKVYVQSVEIPAEQPGEKPMRLRRIEVHLDEPTEDGEQVVRILTNVPKRLLDAKRVAEIYRKRWSIEGLFQRLEASLHSEVRSLGIPAAALLAFCTAVVSFNALSVVQAAIEQAHPVCAQQPLSTFYLATELRRTFDGLRIAVPPEYWSKHDQQSPAEMAQILLEVATQVDPSRLRKSPRGPREKKPKGYSPASEVRRHIATARARAAGTVDYDSG